MSERPCSDEVSSLVQAVRDHARTTHRLTKAEAERDAALAQLELVRALIPYADPELIEAGYAVPADQLILAVGGPEGGA